MCVYHLISLIALTLGIRPVKNLSVCLQVFIVKRNILLMQHYSNMWNTFVAKTMQTVPLDYDSMEFLPGLPCFHDHPVCAVCSGSRDEPRRESLAGWTSERYDL